MVLDRARSLSLRRVIMPGLRPRGRHSDEQENGKGVANRSSRQRSHSMTSRSGTDPRRARGPSVRQEYPAEARAGTGLMPTADPA